MPVSEKKTQASQVLDLLRRGKRGKILALLHTLKGSHINQLCTYGITRTTIKSSLRELRNHGLVRERFTIFSVTERGKIFINLLLQEPYIWIWLEECNLREDFDRPSIEQVE